MPYSIFLSVTSDRKVQCPRVGLGVKIYDTPAGGIRASQGTFLVFYLLSLQLVLCCVAVLKSDPFIVHSAVYILLLVV